MTLQGGASGGGASGGGASGSGASGGGASGDGGHGGGREGDCGDLSGIMVCQVPRNRLHTTRVSVRNTVKESRTGPCCILCTSC